MVGLIRSRTATDHAGDDPAKLEKLTVSWKGRAERVAKTSCGRQGKSERCPRTTSSGWLGINRGRCSSPGRSDKHTTRSNSVKRTFSPRPKVLGLGYHYRLDLPCLLPVTRSPAPLKAVNCGPRSIMPQKPCGGQCVLRLAWIVFSRWHLRGAWSLISINPGGEYRTPS